jgi:hypothetical protein
VTWLKRWREQRALNRDISILWGLMHQLKDDRDFWQQVATDVQLENEQLRRSLAGRHR